MALLGYFIAGLSRDPSAIPSALIDKQLPEFTLPPIEGHENGLSSTALKGQVTLINVFASWCIGCIVEHPELVKISASEEIFIVGINWKDKPGDGTAWLERHGNPYDLIGDDADGRIAIDFGVTGAPETFLIDKNGRIRYKHIGPITQSIWQVELKPRIKALKNAPLSD